MDRRTYGVRSGADGLAPVYAVCRSTMKAFASRVHDLRYFTVIDGYDTVRLLKTYGKCGL